MRNIFIKNKQWYDVKLLYNLNYINIQRIFVFIWKKIIIILKKKQIFLNLFTMNSIIETEYILTLNWIQNFKSQFRFEIDKSRVRNFDPKSTINPYINFFEIKNSIKKQIYKLYFLKKWRIYLIFYIFLLKFYYRNFNAIISRKMIFINE